MQRGLVPKFFYGSVCFTEHFSSCTWWAALAPTVAVLAGVAGLFIPWPRLLQRAPPLPLPPALKQLLGALPPALALTPVLTVAAFAALCPLCARPQSTVWETLEYTLWPPTQLFWGHTYEASGRALAAGAAVAIDAALAGLAARRAAALPACARQPWAQSAAAFAAASAAGALLLQRASGPGTELPGCFVLAPALVALTRLAGRLAPAAAAGEGGRGQ